MKDVPILPSRFNIGLQDGYCNLKCPMCFVHGDAAPAKKRVAITGKMSFEDACRIYNEIALVHPTVNPTLWAETFMNRDICENIIAMKKRGIKVAINTNGLLINDELAYFLVEQEVDSIFFSIDAVSLLTLKKLRGIYDLEAIHAAVFRMLRVRANKNFPRIGTSFVFNEQNEHERKEFIDFWLQHVDVVRVNEEYNPILNAKNSRIPSKRMPCPFLSSVMIINHKGDVPICCLDSFCTINMGNVFESNVEAVWNGERFRHVRELHANGNYEKLELCRNCFVWSHYLVTENIENGIFIRSSPLSTFYNRIDRLTSWNQHLSLIS